MRVNDRGEVIVSVAVPVQRWGQRAINGSLMLSTQGDDIDQMVTAERIAILRVFGVAAAVMIVLSILLASTIAGPVSRLADSAEHVRRRVKARIEIPDFTRRRDEIGHLSGALREMTDSLYNRIEAIERFAADVAHELKNPLTSLRSAVETLPLARNDASRARLLVRHRARRAPARPADLRHLRCEPSRRRIAAAGRGAGRHAAVAEHAGDGFERDQAQQQRHGAGALRRRELRYVRRARTRLAPWPGGREPVVERLLVLGRMAASCTSPAAACAARSKIVVDDEGPGIRADALERIFERFYTDRPHQGFGQNSGLGLSISKQIVEAHGGKIWAENRTGDADADGEAPVLGARFVVRLPAI